MMPNVSASFRRMLAVVLLLTTVAFTSTAFAQLSGKGSIRGTVMDKTGAVVPNVTVTAINSGTSVQTVRESSSAGDYELSSLDPGDYTVSVSAKGFEGFKQTHVHVNVTEATNLDIKLTIGAESETVTVTEAPPALETSNATLGGTMEQEMYAALPLEMGAGNNPDQRRATDFAALMPGVQGNVTSDAGNSTSNSGVVNGSGPKGGVSAIYVNGMPFTNAGGEGDTRYVWTAISVEAVDQFQVLTNGYSALYEGEGVQNYSIKSGSNHIHGSIYDFIRNTAFDTWGFFAPGLVNPYTETTPGVASTGHATKPTEHENEYGLVISGPIIKDKLFYFGNYSGFRFTHGPAPAVQTQPTALMRQGNFSELPSTETIWDPRSTVCNGAGTICTRSQYGPSDPVAASSAPNVIPLSEQSPVALKIQGFLPPNTNTAITNNYLAGFKYGLTNWSTTHRVDYTISANNTASLIVAIGRQASSVPTGQTTAGRNLGPIPINFGQAFTPKTKVYILQDAYTITPHLVNQFNYGFGRYGSETYNTDRGAAYGAASGLGMTGLPAGQASDAFPFVCEASCSASTPQTELAGEPGSRLVANSYDLIDNVQWTKGKHILTFGGQIVWLQYQNIVDTTGTSPVSLVNAITETSNFNANATSTNTATGYAWASFLAGAVDSEQLTQNAVVETGGRFRPISPYVQDTWKATKKLTIDMGLRWDYFPTYREAEDRMSFLNPTGANGLTGNLGTLEFAGSAGGTASCNCHTPINNYMKNFGPRLGIAYALNSKTVIRASYGVMFTHGNAVGGGAASKTGNGTIGFSASVNNKFINTVTGGNPTVQFLDAPFQVYQAPPFLSATYGTGNYNTLGSSGGAATKGPSGQTLSYPDPYLGSRAPEYVNWSVGFQREITNSITLTASYVGSQGHFEVTDTQNARGQFINQLNPLYLQIGAALSNASTSTNVNNALNSATLTAPNYNPATYDPTFKVYQALLPFPQYSLTDTNGNYGNSNFNALQVSLNKRYTSGLTFMVNYTYAKSIDDDGGFRSGYTIPTAYLNGLKTSNNYRIERSESNASQREHIVLTSVYALPFGTGHFGGGNVYTRDIFSGFKFSGIFQSYSGSPLTITGASAACAGGTNGVAPLSEGTCYPSLAPGYTGSGRLNGHWGQGITATNATKQFIDPAAFTSTISSAAAPAYSNAPRTAAYKIFGPGNYDLDLSLRRVFGLGFYHSSLTIQADLYNVTNHTQFGGINTTYTPSTPTSLGQVSTQANSPRQAQFSARLSF